VDECAGEIGVRANLILNGSPPFKLQYRVTHDGRVGPVRVKEIKHRRDEIVFTPDQFGKFTYEFLKLADRNYEDISIKAVSKQTVHPLASVRFTKAGQDEKVWSCEGDSVETEVELKGLPPWSFDYEIATTGVRKTVSVANVTQPRHTIQVPIPEAISKTGGQFSLALGTFHDLCPILTLERCLLTIIMNVVRLQDGRGCRRQLNVPDLTIDVHRSKPSARFYGDERIATVRAGEGVRLPLRLTGQPARFGFLFIGITIS
jgi:nucleoporin POM152